MKKKLLIESLKKIKPKKNFWGVVSVILLFIIPETVAFIWGGEISSFVEEKITTPLPLAEEYTYKALREILGEGSWINLIIGIVILVWAFF